MKVIFNFVNKDKINKYLILYILSVVGIYILGVAPIFASSGLTLNINYKKMLLAVPMYIITILLLPKKKRPSNYLFFLIYIVIFVPTLSYYWLNDKDNIYIIYLTLSIIIIEVLIEWRTISISLPFKNGIFLFWIVFFVYVVSVLVLVIRNGGINRNALNILEISANRTNREINGILGYLLNWCAKSFCPLYFAVFCYKRKWGLMTITVVLQILLYLSFGFKAFLFSIALLILIGITIKTRKNYYSMLALFLVIGIVASYILFAFNISSFPLATLPYRTLYIPAAGQFEYFDFFSNHDFLYFSEGRLGEILGIKYPYSMPIGVIVNQSIHGADYYSNGNTGIFSYGFADFGFVGMILASFVLIILFWIIDGSIKKVPFCIVVEAMAYQMIMLNDMNVLISLNTGGIICTVFLLIIFNSSIEWYDTYQLIEKGK